MGSSVSHQEELFLHRQWSDLLEDAMRTDSEAIETPVSSDNAGCGDHDPTSSNASMAYPATVSATKRKRAKRKDKFFMSFQEWQALLSVLEQKEASSAPSDIAARLTTAQLHVPAVALMVHVCAWWRGAISVTALKDRVAVLTALVEHVQEKHAHGPSLETEEEGKESTTVFTNRNNRNNDTAPANRRVRLANFVQKRVVDRARRRPVSPAQTDVAEDTLLLDTFTDLTCLVEELLTQEAADTHKTDNSQSSTTTAAAACEHAREIFAFCDEKVSKQDALRQRPVLAVVTVLVLAVFASKIDSQPQLALRSVAHLAALEAMIFSSGTSVDNARNPTKSDIPTKASTRMTLGGLWPIVGELEVALVHRQHKADVVECLSSKGTKLMDTLRQMRKQRETLERTKAAANAHSAPPPPPLSASERWTAGASQYIGQRPIWAQLRSHFLSAGIFDADKPTVLVFFGPSGYGKSELAKRVASVLHDCPISELEASGKMVYIHMPSFCTKDSIYSLVDPPAAHVGNGILLSALQKHPDAVVVLDEFEKSTAESINNLWLSAFQKNGVLRSLKEASRSVSTVHTTFILTCNIAADGIAKREELYLAASPADQETIRNLFVTQCMNVCRETMGDPFVNRVDYFFPFMPYTRDERRQFVCLLLERLLSSQAKKDRCLYVTPSFVEAMVDRLRTFHAATLEEAVRSQVMRMAGAGWVAAVLTVERRIGGEVIVLLPTSLSTDAKAAATAPYVAGEETYEGGSSSASSLLVEAWDTLPGGLETLQQWNCELPQEVEVVAAPAAATVPSPSSPLSLTSVTPKAEAATRVEQPATKVCTPQYQQEPQRFDSPLLEKEYEHEYETNKQKIVELEKELEKARGLVKQRDLEIVALKEKVLLLQKAISVVVLTLLSCVCLLAFVVGLKLTLLFVLAIMGVLVLILGVPLALVLEVVCGLFRVLGPFKGCMLVLLAMWMGGSYRSLVTCS